MTRGCLFRYLAQPVLVVCGCLVPLFAADPGKARSPVFPDCLNLSPSTDQFRPTDHPDCSKDALDLGNDKAVHDGETLLNLAPREVSFIGCEAAPFVTFPAAGPNSKFRIYYPTGVQLAHDKYVAPLLHEMGHVFQLKQAGSYANLKASLDDSIERIELGADFIAGFGANHLGLEPNAFLINLKLVGNYNNNDLESHGRPEDRVFAFRNGYFYEEGQPSTVADSYADFQDNRFSQIKHQ
jgi:hypothetical protein